MDKCTDSFDHPSQAITLAGIGPGMSQKLEERMVKYCKENGLPAPQRPGKSKYVKNYERFVIFFLKLKVNSL